MMDDIESVTVGVAGDKTRPGVPMMVYLEREDGHRTFFLPRHARFFAQRLRRNINKAAVSKAERADILALAADVERCAAECEAAASPPAGRA